MGGRSLPGTVRRDRGARELTARRSSSSAAKRAKLFCRRRPPAFAEGGVGAVPSRARHEALRRVVPLAVGQRRAPPRRTGAKPGPPPRATIRRGGGRRRDRRPRRPRRGAAAAGGSGSSPPPGRRHRLGPDQFGECPLARPVEHDAAAPPDLQDAQTAGTGKPSASTAAWAAAFPNAGERERDRHHDLVVRGARAPGGVDFGRAIITPMMGTCPAGRSAAAASFIARTSAARVAASAPPAV